MRIDGYVLNTYEIAILNLKAILLYKRGAGIKSARVLLNKTYVLNRF